MMVRSTPQPSHLDLHPKNPGRLLKFARTTIPLLGGGGTGRLLKFARTTIPLLGGGGTLGGRVGKKFLLKCQFARTRIHGRGPGGPL
jgi:hypothetical protein